MPRIQQVTMRNFRGAATSSAITFARKPLILIFGENGTGKSTIVDAIDLVCNEGYGTVDERSSTTRKDHLPTIGTRPAQVEVQIEFDSGTWTGTLNAAGKAQIRPDHLRPTVRVLRRRSLLKLTEDTPGDRYKQLQSLIDVNEVERSETQLKEAAQEINRRLNDATTTISHVNSLLDDLWDMEDRPGISAVHWARERTSIDEDTLREYISADQDRLEHLRRLHAAQERHAHTAQKFQEAQQELDVLEHNLRDQGQTLHIDLMQLLELTQAYLPHAQPDQCPTCQQPFNLQRLQQDIQERLNDATHLNTLNTQRHAAQQNLDSARHAWSAAQTELSAAQTQAQQTTTTMQEVQDAGTRLLLNQTNLENHRAIRIALDDLAEATASAHQLERTLDRLNTMQGALRQTRVEFTQAIFDQVSAETQRLYQRIHPSEPIGLSGIHLDPDRRASLHQKATFHGHDDVAPQGFYSEAHLDTLGFCFWLAVIKHTTPGAIIVLDDVFTSVDAAHLNRIDQMLLDEATSGALSQIIVITHYRGWLDKLKYEFPAQLDVKELGQWNLARGISVRNVIPNTSELRQLLNDPFLQRQDVASKAGILLEAMLDHLTTTFEMSLPRGKKYTLADLLEPVIKSTTASGQNWHTLHSLADPATPTDPTTAPSTNPQSWKPILTRLKSITFIRNQVGAHFTTGGSEITDQDIRDFAEATLAFADLIYCSICKKRAYSKDHGTHRSCGGTCKKTHLTSTAPTTVPTPSPAGQ
ncbi:MULTISPECIES: AAA family ATPase [unclassified Deinococcus]|uniref:AAA family ATPase n=1 Tax=unclassified Deinococcus TaxID=2623546 RepID=UPI001C2F5D47|nr:MULTISPECIES: AAA family ATPase [unclassified Deinococcus]MDK2012275.1 AAA family ATPase [Deinococcus sp. 43]